MVFSMALQDNKWSHVYNRMLSDKFVNTREYLDSFRGNKHRGGNYNVYIL